MSKIIHPQPHTATTPDNAAAQDARGAAPVARRFNPFARVNCQYGAPMGRRGNPIDDYDGKSMLYARHCGGDGYYDRGGAYWGHSRVYAVWTRGGRFCAYVEANGTDGAKGVVRAAAPDDVPELPVIFRVYRGELCAYFPTEVFDRRGNITCYAAVGQHGSASPIWLSKGRRATHEEYAPLLRELRNIYETDRDPIALKVYTRATGKAALKRA